MRVLAIQNCPVEGFGLYEEYILEKGIQHDLIHAYRMPDLPSIDGYDAILVGGTPASARNVERDPFLRTLSEYLAPAIEAGKPCFGICCGGQILARLLGAEIRKADRKEIGGYEVSLTPAGRADSLTKGLPETFPVFQWHGDTFELPEDADLIAQGDDCRNQMFRKGTVVGVLFHLEVTGEEAASWADAYEEELANFGKTRDQVVAECREREEEMRRLAFSLLESFLDLA